jgi:hypothetical protein
MRPEESFQRNADDRELTPPAVLPRIEASMTFRSPEFILFLATVVLLYFSLPFRHRNPLLLAASAFFYMWWRPDTSS